MPKKNLSPEQLDIAESLICERVKLVRIVDCDMTILQSNPEETTRARKELKATRSTLTAGAIPSDTNKVKEYLEFCELLCSRDPSSFKERVMRAGAAMTLSVYLQKKIANLPTHVAGYIRTEKVRRLKEIEEMQRKPTVPGKFGGTVPDRVIPSLSAFQLSSMETSGFTEVTNKDLASFLQSFQTVRKAVFIPVQNSTDLEDDGAFRVVGNSHSLSQTVWEIQYEDCEDSLHVNEDELCALLLDSKFAWVN